MIEGTGEPTEETRKRITHFGARKQKHMAALRVGKVSSGSTARMRYAMSENVSLARHHSAQDLSPGGDHGLVSSVYNGCCRESKEDLAVVGQTIMADFPGAELNIHIFAM